jgi:hypothetical protein
MPKLFNKRISLWLGVMIGLLLAACTSTGRGSQSQSTITGNGGGANVVDTSKYDQYEIVTLLPRDAIPAIDNPQFLSVAEAQRFYDADELVIGVEFNGEARAYSVPFLSNHEIVNDTVGGEKIAVTW